MKLKSLTLHGFKSFADKTEFEFRDGITVIVGPNGCGKSNVVDAIKWVLGEQRPTSLRGKEMMDVIFSGTDQRKSVGFSEVALTFDNSSGLLAVDYEEVVVTRRLYRSGESEYLLNGSRVRLRDVRELLMDSGGGPGALTVMEQGNIDRLLRADPHERRQVFEEAAGISKYRARRKETQRKLERTGDNLARLRDILGEYETRQRSLKIQAGKARRYTEFTAELKKKRLVGALARYRDLFSRQENAQSLLDTISENEATAREALELALEASTGQRTRLDALREQIRERESERGRLFAEARADEEKKAALQREAAGLGVRAEEAEREGAEAARRAAAFRGEMDGIREGLDAAAEEQRQRAEALEAADALFREAEERVRLLREERDALDMKRTDAFAAETEARNEEVAGDAEARSLRARLERISERAKASGEELATLQAEHQASRAHLDEAEARVKQLEEEHATAEEGAREARVDLDLSSAEEREHSGRAAAFAARRDLLESLVEKGEGLDIGTRALLHAAREGAIPGVLGMVAELIDDPGGQAAALDLALGPVAGAVVVETTAQAQAALDWLRRGKRGRACVLPLDRVPEADLPERFAGVRSRIAGALGALLAGVEIVPTVEEALARPAGSRIVVLTGEEFAAEGTIAGGHGGSQRGSQQGSQESESGTGLVQLRADLQEIAGQLATAVSARDAGAKRVASARERAAGCDETLADLRPRLKRARDELRGASESLASAEQAAVSRSDEIDIDQAERAEVEESLTSCATRAAEAKERRETAEALRRGLEGESSDLGERIVVAQTAREEAAGGRTEARVDAARWTEKADSLRQRVEHLEKSIESAARDAEIRSQEVTKSVARRQECIAEVAAIEEQALTRTETLDALGAEIEEWRGRAQQLQDLLDAGDRQARELRDAHEKHRGELERHRLEEHEIRLRIETLLEQVQRDYELDLVRLADEEPEAEAGTEGEEAPDPELLEAEISELQAKLERLGNVNHAALEELEQVEDKLNFMRREEGDLVSAEKQLLETIDKIDEECTTRFTATFDEVTEHFKTVFRKLFGGGKAEIFLEEPEDVLGSGIEIRVRPPGKELRNMALLSGGERSLTAVALLFSIYSTKPPPFCLLDEVDAALDEANTVRMCEMIREFAHRGQFVIITHARPTMTIADTLYGVTMPEAGVSRRVAVRFEDIEAGAVVGLN
ncbi:MAG: chromosome segregation protein SMC [Planctomycetota bacterium]|jgi:chromosome segregation protein